MIYDVMLRSVSWERAQGAPDPAGLLPGMARVPTGCPVRNITCDLRVKLQDERIVNRKVHPVKSVQTDVLTVSKILCLHTFG